jgi:hypothetical protein
MMGFFRVLTVCMSIVSMYVVSSCNKEVKTGSEEPSATVRPRETLFTLLSSQQTNIDFKNTLVEGLNTNILMYEYFYNGGGVAAGDVNNDGLTGHLFFIQHEE